MRSINEKVTNLSLLVSLIEKCFVEHVEMKAESAGLRCHLSLPGIGEGGLE